MIRTIIFIALSLSVLISCQQSVEPDDQTTIVAEILPGDVRADTARIQITTHSHIHATSTENRLLKSASLQKTFDVDDWIILAEVLQNGDASFSGTIHNRATNPVDLNIRMHYQRNVPAPEENTLLVSPLTLAANSTSSLSNLLDIDQAMSAAALFFQGSDSLCIYFLAEGDPEIDVSIEDMKLLHVPATRVTNILRTEDCNASTGTLPAIIDSRIVGALENTGSDTVSLKIYMSVEDAGFWPALTPPASDLVLVTNILSGQTTDGVAWISDPVADVLTSRIIQALENQSNLWITTVLTSNAPISLDTDGLAIEWDIVFGG